MLYINSASSFQFEVSFTFFNQKYIFLYKLIFDKFIANWVKNPIWENAMRCLYVQSRLPFYSSTNTKSKTNDDYESDCKTRHKMNE